MTDDYDDIINLPHHVSKSHPQMTMYQRAAQFAPFAALVGHDAMIAETARLTDNEVEMEDGVVSGNRLHATLLSQQHRHSSSDAYALPI